MDTELALRTLALRAAWRPRDRWDRRRLEVHQARALESLRRHAYARSAFYRRHHAGLMTAPLSELPVVTKAELMARYDDVLVDHGVSLDALEAHLRTMVANDLDPGRAWRRHWWVAATAGTSGRRGVFAWRRAEWARILASYARVNDWAGVGLAIRDPLRLAVVSSLNPSHQSAVVGATVRSALVPTLRLDATSPLEDQREALERFQPRVLVGYPSALRPLASEQLAGRLHLAPRAVMSASEVLTPQAADEMSRAWGSRPWDVYAATETATIASPCAHGTRHVYEDLLVCESVDDDGAVVPPGETGSRLLVSVLFSRTLPLIRYELTDRVRLGGTGCPCGRPYRALLEVEGRLQDVLVLPGVTGDDVRVPPGVFHAVLDDVSVAGWQVIRDARGLRILLAGRGEVDPAPIHGHLLRRLSQAGVAPLDVRVERVEVVPRTPLGKTPLIRTDSGR